MRSQHRQAGFTLIEIMVAVSILVIISVLLWQTTAVMMQAKGRYEVEDIRFHEVLMALTRISDDLTMAFLYQSADHLGATGAGEPQRTIRFLGKDNGDQDELHFATLGHLRVMKDSKESEQAEVGYLLKEATGDEGQVWNLVKRTQSPPDRDPEQGGQVYIMLENIQEFKLQYYDEGRKEWRREWDSNSLDSNKRLPKAVEITIVIPDPIDPDETRSFTTTALLAMAPGPNDF